MGFLVVRHGWRPSAYHNLPYGEKIITRTIIIDTLRKEEEYRQQVEEVNGG